MLPRPPADASLVVDLARIVGADGVSTADPDRFAYARDCWPRDLIRVRSGEVPTAPACIVWPETPEEVARVLALAAQLSVPIVPFGAGSGVAGGARPVDGGITLDLKRMRRIRSLESKDLRAEVEAGIMGERLERLLNSRGFTLGHFPSSIICSTLGGWVAGRSAGQTSTLYGKIEDMTHGLEFVTPGRVRHLVTGPRPGSGPDMNALVIGSEGTFGVVTAADLRIRPLPEARQMRGYRFSDVEAGVEAIRKILRAGIRPAVVRLYDALDTFLGRGHGQEDEEAEEARSLEILSQRARSLLDDFKLPARIGGQIARTIVRGTVRAVLGSPLVLNRAIDALPADCLLVLGFEGQPALVAAEFAAAASVCAREGAEDLGAGPGDHWFKNRYNVSFKQSKAYATGVFTDTMEVAATWDRLMPLYRAVRKAIAKDAFVMAHFSHAYPEGCSIYFTMAGALQDGSHPEASLARYDRIWRNALVAANEVGGTISHHHGIGILKAEAMAREHGPGGIRLLGALKYGFDPSGIMNPGKLGLGVSARPKPHPVPVDRPRGFPSEIVAAVGEGNLVVQGARTVVRPPDESGLAAVLRVAHARRIALATDQTGFRAPTGAVRIDLSRFEGVSRLSTHSLFVEAEAGVRVDRLEAMLNRHGLTLGEVHPRAHARSVGACLARHLLIRRGVAFGDLRDIGFAARGLLANGAPIETRPVPRSATGPELDRALFGCFGRWGIITRGTLRVALKPTRRASLNYQLENVADAVNCARRSLRRGVRPAAGRVTSDGLLLLDLVAYDEGVLDAQRTIVSSMVSHRGGEPVQSEEIATGGRFDAVVEVAARYTQLDATLSAMKDAAQGETWIDFLTPEGATVVTRVADRESRHATVEAGHGAGGRVVAGSRTGDHIEEQGEGIDWAPYEDVAERVAAALDPTGVFRGR